jgi:pyridoxal phosphate enzyme (YggS family)
MSDIFTHISAQHKEVMARLAQAAKRANRAADDITLVAVSKVQPDERISAMLDMGHKVYGENRVQEAQGRWGERFASYRKDIELRLIGPLQSNKTEDAVKLFDVIETVDREKILKTLVKVRDSLGIKLPRLYVQVNTGEEPQKSGVLPKDLVRFIKLMRESYGLHPEGLMCIPPQNEAPTPHFWLLKKLAEEVKVEKLSMGMSGDFESAIELGASSVRVGSALFGERDYG